MLNKAIEYIKNNQLKTAANELNSLLTQYPDMKDEIEAYTDLLSKQEEIKEDIFRAAQKAKKEKRLLESKILYLYLGIQYPETQPQIQPYINEIGKQAVVSLAEVEDDGRIDRVALGLGIHSAGGSSPFSESEKSVPEEIDQDKIIDIAAVEVSHEGESDLLCAVVNIDGESVADFIY